MFLIWSAAVRSEPVTNPSSTNCYRCIIMLVAGNLYHCHPIHRNFRLCCWQTEFITPNESSSMCFSSERLPKYRDKMVFGAFTASLCAVRRTYIWKQNILHWMLPMLFVLNESNLCFSILSDFYIFGAWTHANGFRIPCGSQSIFVWEKIALTFSTAHCIRCKPGQPRFVIKH